MARLFDRGVVLRLGAREIRAASAEALRASLAGQAAVNPARMAELGALDDHALGARAAALEDLTARLAGALARGDVDPAEMVARIQAEDTPLEPSWSDALAIARGWTAGYQLALLEALVEHLAGERDCVRTLLANRGRVPAAPGSAADAESAPRQRLLLDADALAGEAGARPAFDRMPKGVHLEIPMSAGQALSILLAQHRYLVVAGTPWLLVDELGEDIKLKPGRNVVGRSPDCDAVVHESCRAVSRRHAVLETEGTTLLRITDISSLGTFVPRAYLDNRLH